ncbi:hypothetical protein EC957_005398 [Mortierella hygrophila]|uniref:Galactose oxidase n=1 Tax=Mortierella hygrophila TaxID=979708 RepID=A0A9P6F0Z9_9FUNG|nr:hypothetical protein EC957_005398 [Mortierella hygrophila]
MALDLSVAWPNTAPAWTQLEPGPKQTNFPAVFSKDFLTFYAFHITAAISPPISSTFQYNVKTGKWTPTAGSSISGDVGGVGAVTNPLTGAIICAGGCTDVGRGKVHIWDPLAKTTVLQYVDFPEPFPSVPLTGPAGVFQSRSHYANVWSEAQKSVLYFGGYAGYGAIKPDNTVTMLNGTSYELTTMKTFGAPPPNTMNHCMAASDDGVVIIYGGQNIDAGGVNGDLYQVNTVSGLWSMPNIIKQPRANAVCTIVGDLFLLYGGTDDKDQVSNSLLMYDYVKMQWITQYSPPASIGQPLYPLVPPTNSTLTPKPTNSTGPSTSPPTATTSPGPGVGDDGSKGGLIGGIVAAIVVVGIIVGYILYHRRQRQREEKRQEQQVGGGDDHGGQFAAKEDFGRGSKDEWNAQSQRGRPQANTKNDYDGDEDGAYAVVTGHQKPRAPQDTQDEYKRPPQAPQDVDDTEEFEQDLHEIENQQMQLDLKRQLLVLQQRQGQRVVGRSSPPRPELNHAGSISSDGSSGGGNGSGGRWPRPPAIVGEPQYVQKDEYVPPPPPPKAVLHHPTVQAYPERPSSSNYGYGYADSRSVHRGHNPQTFD